MAAVVAYSQPTELPSTLSIGTQKAFAGGYEYNYRFVDDINIYVCDHQTTTNVPGEVMALQVASDENGQTWYVAAEGTLVDGQRFDSRQIVFRTTERFWEPGKHSWLLIANSSATNTINTVWGDNMSAITKVPEDVALVAAAVGLLQIADA